MLGDLLRLSLRATAAECRGDGTSTSTGENEASRIPHPPPAVASTLLLLRNLALAPSTGEVCNTRGVEFIVEMKCRVVMCWSYRGCG